MLHSLTIPELICLIVGSWAIALVFRYVTADDEGKKRLERSREAVPIIFIVMAIILWGVYTEVKCCKELLQQILDDQTTIVRLLRS